jgi:lysylphosphatidylglycerol synthetase-like protein (DUF2156 family)
MLKRNRRPPFAQVSALLSLAALASAIVFLVPVLQGTDYIPAPWLVLAAVAVLLPPPSLVLGILAIRASRRDAVQSEMLVLSWVAVILSGVLTASCSLLSCLFFTFVFLIEPLLYFPQIAR